MLTVMVKPFGSIETENLRKNTSYNTSRLLSGAPFNIQGKNMLISHLIFHTESESGILFPVFSTTEDVSTQASLNQTMPQPELLCGGL